MQETRCSTGDSSNFSVRTNDLAIRKEPTCSSGDSSHFSIRTSDHRLRKEPTCSTGDSSHFSIRTSDHRFRKEARCSTGDSPHFRVKISDLGLRKEPRCSTGDSPRKIIHFPSTRDDSIFNLILIDTVRARNIEVFQHTSASGQFSFPIGNEKPSAFPLTPDSA